MADTLSHSSDAQALKLLSGSAPGYFEQNGIAQGAPPSKSAGGQTRRSISRLSAPVSAGSTFRRQKPQGSKIFEDPADGHGSTPAGQEPQDRQSVRMDSAGEMAGAAPSTKSVGNYARKLALTQAKAGLLPLPTAAKQQGDADGPTMRPSGLLVRHSDSVAVTVPSIRRASGAPNSSVAAGSSTPPRPSIRRASAAPSIGGAPRPSISCRSVGSGSTLVGGRTSISRMSGLGGQRPAADSIEECGEEERPRLRWRRNLDGVSDAPKEAPAASVDEDKAALMRRIAKLAVAEDEAVLQQMREQRSGQVDDAQAAGTHVLPPPAAKGLQKTVRSDSASSREEASVQQLEIYQQAPEDSAGRQRELVDWRPVLAAMTLSANQKRAAHDARLALDASLAQLHVQRAALYKTLCSFATTDADDGLEDAISDTKQELIRNEAAEAEELRAFRYTFRSALAGPLLAARSVIRAVCPDASPDFLALADVIKADLEQSGDDGGSDAPAAAQPMRRRSRVVIVNPHAIPEDAEEEG